MNVNHNSKEVNKHLLRKLIINKQVNTSKMSAKLEQNIHLLDDRICSYYIRKHEESDII